AGDGGAAAQAGSGAAAAQAGNGGLGASSGGPPKGGESGSSGSAGAAGTLSDPPPPLECGDACTAAGHDCVENECRAAPGRMLWQARIDDRYVDYPGGVASDSQGNALYAASYQVRLPALGQRLAVHKVTPQGRELWTHTFEGSLGAMVTAIAVDAEDRAYVSTSTLGRAAPTLRAIDAGGGLVRETTFDLEALAGISAIAVDSDENVVLAGYTDFMPPRMIVLKKLDRNGDELWSKTLHDGWTYAAGYGLAVTSNGDIALASGTSSDIKAAWIGLLDPDGDPLWERTYGVDGATVAAFAVVEGAEGELIAGGQVLDGTSFLRRYTAAGDLVSHVDLFGPEREFFGLAAGPEGTIFASGTAYSMDDNLQAWVSQLSPDGGAPWEFFDALDAFPFGRSASEVAVTPAGDVLVEGQIQLSPGSVGIWAARLAGPNGGVPVVGADDVEPLLERPYPDHDGSAIFVDSEIPSCVPSGATNFILTGELDGEPVSAMDTSSSELDATRYAGGGLGFEWETYIVEGSTIELSGGYVIVPEGHPRAGEVICIQAGELGVLPAVIGAVERREFKFRVTRASYGDDCSGGEATVNLTGCVNRSAEFLPSP
ncbi:MAG TPA: hypothetical protein VGK73_23090, partial [Polyangiaceae bacterium]